MMILTEKEIVGLNSSTTLPPSTSLTTHPPSLAIAGTMASPRQKNDKCFRCLEIGHWSQNCPIQTPNNTSRRSHSPDDHGVPFLYCRCQVGPCLVQVAGPKTKHPGWKFYCCPSRAKDCGFFKWCKDVKKEDIVERPICRCEAGLCRIEGKFYVCHIKKGQGACSFSKPLDAPNNQSDSTNTSHVSTLTDCQETVEDPVLPDGDPYYLSDEQLEAVDLDGNINSPQPTLTNSGNSSPSSSGVVENGDIAHFGIEIDPNGLFNVEAGEDTVDVPLRRHKRLRHGAPKENGLTLGSATKPPQLSTAMVDNLAIEETFTGLASEDSVHLRQMEFSRQIALAEDSPSGGVFPKLDPVDNPQFTCNELKGSAEGLPPDVSPGTKMAEEKVRFQNKIAMQLQDALLSELESTVFHEHEFLADKAAITFHLLKDLPVQYQPFKDTVDEFINKAKSLAEAEESNNSDMTSFELVEKQKQRLEEVTRRHSETLVALDASNQHLEELEKDARKLREMLAHAEEKLDCCKAEIAAIKTELDLISKHKSESEVSFEVASIEAVKIQQQKEAELGVVKAELDKARSNLRQSCITYVT